MAKTLMPVLVALLGSCGGDTVDTFDDAVLVEPRQRGDAERAWPEPAAGRGKPRSGAMIYHGGPLLLGTANVYYIYYGSWSASGAVPILDDLARSIGGSPYYNINATYHDGTPTAVSNSVALAGTTSDGYSRGSALSDSDIRDVVAAALTSGRLPTDDHGVYFVLTSADVTATSGFCKVYCGWHTHALLAGHDIKYAFVGNPDRCPSACAEQSIGPNGNAGADGMASIIAHELEEAVTDPDLDAWYDRRGMENADRCAWQFGATYTVANGARANMRLGSRDFLIQQNWVNVGAGYCALRYP